jgi:hypothetical protein
MIELNFNNGRFNLIEKVIPHFRAGKYLRNEHSLASLACK